MAIALSTRLQTIADLVPRGARVVDVGTDHALLPIYLVQSGTVAFAVATDIAEQPCAVARRNVQSHGLQSIISVRCGFGLYTVVLEEVDTVLIAGMGGATIAAILEQAPEVVSRVGSIIVQPMNHAAHVRRFFRAADWHLDAERAVVDSGKYYEVLAVRPRSIADADVYQDFIGDRTAESIAMELGPLMLQHPTPEFLQHVDGTLRQWGRQLVRMQESSREDVRTREHQLREQHRWLSRWRESVLQAGITG